MAAIYTVVASCTYRDEVRRYDIEADSAEQAREQAADLYGHESTIGVDTDDVVTTLPNTVRALAAELGVTIEDMNTWVGQIAEVDGIDFETVEVRNGSGRVITPDVLLTTDAEAFIREGVATGQLA